MSVTAHRGVSAQSAIVIAGARLLLKPLIALYPLRSWSLGPLVVAERIAETISWTPTGVELERTRIAGVDVECVTPLGPDVRSDAALVYYHGGAFLSGGPATHRRLASVLARTLGVTVFNVNYRQLPEVGIGTSVDDGYRVFRAVADAGEFATVLVGGDSAGGYIAAKTCESAYLDGMAGPNAYFGYSPLLNPTVSEGDPRGEINDAYLTVGKLAALREFLDRGPVAARGADDAVHIPPAAFPPALLIACSNEMLRIDAERLHVRLDAAGQQCELHLFDGGVHAFPVLAGATPESAEAVGLTVAFLESVLGAGRFRRAAA